MKNNKIIHIYISIFLFVFIAFFKCSYVFALGDPKLFNTINSACESIV